MKGKLELTPRGRITLLLVHLVGSAAWLTLDSVAIFATATLAAPFLIDWFVKLLAPPSLELGLHRRRARAGEPFLEHLTVRNRRNGAPSRGIEVFESRSAVRGGRAFIETLPPRTDARIELPARMRSRGIFASRTFELSTTWPFGMLRWRAIAEVATQLVVEPGRTELDPDLLIRLDLGPEDSVGAGASFGGEFFAMREHFHGDDARLVHARRSATRGALVTREQRSGRDPEIAIVVDVRRAAWHTPAISDSRFESRLSIAATLLDEALARNLTPTCIILGGAKGRFEVRSSGTAEAFLDELAQARLVPSNTRVSSELDALRGTAFWISAGGHDGRDDHRRFDDLVLIEDAEPR